VVTVHGSDFRMAAEGSSFLRKMFLFVCHHAHSVHCVSEAMRRGLEEMGLKRKKYRLSPWGSMRLFFEAGKNRERRSKDKPWTVLSNRNLHPLYNIPLLIRAIPMVLEEEPKTRFLIAGEGPEKRISGKGVGSFESWIQRPIPGTDSKREDARPSGGDGHLRLNVPFRRNFCLSARSDGSRCVPDCYGNSFQCRMGYGSKERFPGSDRGRRTSGEKDYRYYSDETLAEGSRLENADIIRRRALWSVVLEKTKEIYHGALESQGSKRHKDCL